MFNSIRNLFTTYGLWDYGQVADDPKPKTDGAFAFSMMSDLIPTSSSVRGRRAYEYRGTGWEPVDPDPGDGVTGAVPDAWTAAGLLYRFNPGAAGVTPRAGQHGRWLVCRCRPKGSEVV